MGITENDWRLASRGRLKALQILFVTVLIVYIGLFVFGTKITGMQISVVIAVTFVALLISGWIRWNITRSIARDKIKQWLDEFRGMADGEVKVFEDPSQVVVNEFHCELNMSGIPHVPDLRGGTTVKVTRVTGTDSTA